MSEAVRCPYCNKLARRVAGTDIYPHRLDLADKRFFRCDPCDAYVGCHPNGKPMGRLANAELRVARRAVHRLFDPLWQNGNRTRSEAYALLASGMNLSPQRCHIGDFTLEQCAAAQRFLME